MGQTKGQPNKHLVDCFRMKDIGVSLQERVIRAQPTGENRKYLVMGQGLGLLRVPRSGDRWCAVLSYSVSIANSDGCPVTAVATSVL